MTDCAWCGESAGIMSTLPDGTYNGPYFCVPVCVNEAWEAKIGTEAIVEFHRRERARRDKKVTLKPNLWKRILEWMERIA